MLLQTTTSTAWKGNKSPPHETLDEPSDEEVDTPADPNEDDLDLLGLNQL